MAKYLGACDDGHGMETAGKRTPALKEKLMYRGKTFKKGSVIHENDFNEQIMEYFIKGCKRCGIDTLQVATGDKDVSLATRVKAANNARADFYISFHANALEGTKWQEKAYGLVVIKHYNCQAKTTDLANYVYKYLSKEVDWYGDGGTKYGVRKDIDISGFSLYVLKNTNMPAILVEYGFMDNWKDVLNMVNPEWQKSCAEATLKGVCKWLGVAYIKESVPVSSKKKKLIKNIHTGSINIRDTADWEGKVVGQLKAGDSLTYAKKVNAKNGKTKMYETVLGTYVTASSKYTKVIEV